MVARAEHAEKKLRNYAKGARYEREVAQMFREAGYEVTRAAGSKSPFDVIATKLSPTTKKVCFIALVQCKTKKP